VYKGKRRKFEMYVVKCDLKVINPDGERERTKKNRKPGKNGLLTQQRKTDLKDKD